MQCSCFVVYDIKKLYQKIISKISDKWIICSCNESWQIIITIFAVEVWAHAKDGEAEYKLKGLATWYSKKGKCRKIIGNKSYVCWSKYNWIAWHSEYDCNKMIDS